MDKHKKLGISKESQGRRLEKKEEDEEVEGEMIESNSLSRSRRSLDELRQSLEFTTRVSPPRKMTDIGVPEKLSRMVIDICLIVEKSRQATSDMFHFLFDGNMKKMKKKLTKEETDQMKRLLELIEYIKIGNKHEVGKFLRFFREKFEPFAFNNLPVVAACAYGQVEIIKYLISLSSHVNPSACKDIGIISAGRRGHLNVIKFLMKDHRVDITARNNSLLINAIYGLHLDIVKLLQQQQDEKVSLTSRDYEAFKFVGKQGNIELMNRFLDEYQDEMDNSVRFGNIICECATNDNFHALEHLFQVEDEKKIFEEEEERLFTRYWINRSFVKSCEQGHLDCVKLFTTSSKSEPDLTKNGVRKAFFEAIRNKRKDIIIYLLNAEENDQISPRLKRIIKDILINDFLEILRLLNENQIDLDPSLLVRILEMGLSHMEKNWASLKSTLSSLRNFLPSPSLIEAVVRLFKDLLDRDEFDDEFKSKYCDLLTTILEGGDSYKYVSFVRLTLSRWVDKEKYKAEDIPQSIKKYGEYKKDVKSFDNKEDHRIFGKFRLIDKISLTDRENGKFLDDSNTLCPEDFEYLVHLKQTVVWAHTREDYWDSAMRDVPFLPKELALAVIKIWKRKNPGYDPYVDLNEDLVCQLIWTESSESTIFESLFNGPFEVSRLSERIRKELKEKERVERKVYSSSENISDFDTYFETVLSEEVFNGTEIQNLDYYGNTKAMKGSSLPYAFRNKEYQQKQIEEQIEKTETLSPTTTNNNEEKQEQEGEEEDEEDDDQQYDEEEEEEFSSVMCLCPSYRLNLEGFLGNLEEQKSQYFQKIVSLTTTQNNNDEEEKFKKEFFSKSSVEFIRSCFINSMNFQNYDREVIDSMFTFLLSGSSNDYIFNNNNNNNDAKKEFCEKMFKISAENGVLENLKLLLMNDIENFPEMDLSISNSYQFRAGCRKGHLEIVEFLVNFYSNNVNFGMDQPFDPFEKGNEAMIVCAEKGFSEILRIILGCEKIKKDLLDDDEKVHNLCISAAKYEQYEVIEVLKEKECWNIDWEKLFEENNKKKRKKKKEEDDNYYVEEPNQIEAMNLFNELKIACVVLEEDMIEGLIENEVGGEEEEEKPNFFPILSPHQISILLELIEDRSDKQELVEFILMSYGRVNRNENYLFRWACSGCHISILKCLLKNIQDFDIDISSLQNEALIFSSRWGNHFILQKLLSNKNITNISCRNNLSIEYACERGQVGIVELLVQQKNILNNYVVEQINDERIENYIIQKYNSSLSVLKNVCSNHIPKFKLVEMKLRTITKDIFSKYYNSSGGTKKKVHEDDDEYYDNEYQKETSYYFPLSWYSGTYGTWWRRSVLLECSMIRFIDYETLMKNHEEWFYFPKSSTQRIRRIYRLENNDEKLKKNSQLQFIPQSKKSINLFISKCVNNNNQQEILMEKKQKYGWIFVMGERKGFELEESLFGSAYMYNSEALHRWITSTIEPEIEKLKEWAKENEISVPGDEDDDDNDNDDDNDDNDDEPRIKYYAAKCEEWIENKYSYLNVRFDAEIPEWKSDDEDDDQDDDEDRKKIQM